MSRFDKYEPRAGGFRAPLNAALTSGNVGKLYVTSVNSSGKAVVGGAAAADISGVICPVRTMAANEVIDNMTSGEVVEATTTAGVTLVAGSLLYGHTDGTVDGTATAGKVVGRVLEVTTTGARVAIRVAQG